MSAGSLPRSMTRATSSDPGDRPTSEAREGAWLPKGCLAPSTGAAPGNAEVSYRGGMSVVPSAVGLVASDLSRTLAFYRLLGLDIPDDADKEPHVEVTLPGGFRIMF